MELFSTQVSLYYIIIPGKTILYTDDTAIIVELNWNSWSEIFSKPTKSFELFQHD